MQGSEQRRQDYSTHGHSYNNRGSGAHRGRYHSRPAPYNASGRRHGASPAVTAAHAEDSQPNESIDKRKQAAPPTIISTASRNLKFGRGHGGGNRGRGHHSTTGAPFSFNSARQAHYPNSSGRGSFSIKRPSKPSPPVSSPKRIPSALFIPPSVPADKCKSDHIPPSNARQRHFPLSSTSSPLSPSTVSHVPTPPPSKRRKLSHDTSSNPPALKFEETDVLPTRSLVTAGSQWYHPLPSNCLKTSANWAANRQAWRNKEAHNLRERGLKVVRSFFRDDGMVIDWTSEFRPVWSDTLQPEQSTSSAVSSVPTSSRAQTELNPPTSEEYAAPSSSLSIPTTHPTKKKSTSGSRKKKPLAQPNNFFFDDIIIMPNPSRESTPTPNDDNLEEPIHTNSRYPHHSPSDELPSYEDSVAHEKSEEVIVIDDDDDDEVFVDARSSLSELPVAEDTEARERMVQLALEYLQHFIIHFDRDRASLEDAYTDYAILSCSVVRDKTLIVSEARAFSGCSSDSLLAIGPQEISRALMSFGDHRFFPHNTESSHIDYDIVCLENDQVLLIIHTRVVNDMGKRVAVDQTFILSSHTDDSCQWPLLAISHQMVLRDSNWLPARLVTIPWST